MKSEQSTWEKLVKYINSKGEDEIITRRDMRENLMKNKNSIHTLDNYRLILYRLGIISWISWGKYRKIKNIPTTLSSTKAREIAFDDSWKSWFTPLEILDKLTGNIRDEI